MSPTIPSHPPRAARSRRGLRGWLRAAHRDENGATALEFALIAPVFLALLFSFYDVGVLMLRDAMLSHAVERNIRDLRIYGSLQTTGSGSGGGLPIDEFIDATCRIAFLVGSCRDELVVDLTKAGRRGENLPTDATPCKQPGQPVLRPKMQFNRVQQGQIMFMRVCATSKPLVKANFLGYNFAKLLANGEQDGQARIIVSTAFMAE